MDTLYEHIQDMFFSTAMIVNIITTNANEEEPAGNGATGKNSEACAHQKVVGKSSHALDKHQGRSSNSTGLFFFHNYRYDYLMQEFISTSSLQTKKLGQLLAEELYGGEIICLSGELGAGKTTFTQGLLKGLKIKGPYTSPTFTIVKHYCKSHNAKRATCNSKTLHVPRSTIHDVFHIDAYRISSKDLLELGFKDFAGKENSVTIIEWPEKVKKLIPTNALWINFEWLSEKERRITLSTKKEL